MRRITSILAIAATVLTAACNDSNDPSENVLGTTPGWFNGREVTFSYTADFVCARVTGQTIGATSGCAGGVEADARPNAPELDPSAEAPAVYVMVPLFTPAPPATTLHCPTSDCITHPTTIDLTRVLGPGTGNAALPPHSHIVGQLAGNLWEIEVVGVTTRAAWDEMVAAKSLSNVRQIQARQNSPMTGDIPTNLFLFFDVEDRVAPAGLQAASHAAH